MFTEITYSSHSPTFTFGRSAIVAASEQRRCNVCEKRNLAQRTVWTALIDAHPFVCLTHETR